MRFVMVICERDWHVSGTVASGAGRAMVGYEAAPALNALMTSARYAKDQLRVRLAEDDTLI